MSDLIRDAAELGGYLFRITDNGGATADRYTVIFSDGDYLSLSAYPDSPLGVSQWGEQIDLAGVAERVEEGEEVDLSWGCLPESIRAHVLSRINEGWRDCLEAGEAGLRGFAKSREAAEVHEGLHTSGGTGIYAAGSGFCIRLDSDNAGDDRGPYETFREALLNTLPDPYGLAGPEYHSPVINDGPQTDTAYPEILAAAAALEAKVREAGDLDA